MARCKEMTCWGCPASFSNFAKVLYDTTSGCTKRRVRGAPVLCIVVEEEAEEEELGELEEASWWQLSGPSLPRSAAATAQPLPLPLPLPLSASTPVIVKEALWASSYARSSKASLPSLLLGKEEESLYLRRPPVAVT